MKKAVKVFIVVVVLGIIGFLYYYIALPAVNIHSPGLWWVILGTLLLLTAILGIRRSMSKRGGYYGTSPVYGIFFKVICCVTGLLLLVFLIGGILSSKMLHAGRYQKLLTVTERNYTDDIKEISYKEIPILDKDSAILLGSRKMGSITEYVSQFIDGIPIIISSWPAGMRSLTYR